MIRDRALFRCPCTGRVGRAAPALAKRAVGLLRIASRVVSIRTGCLASSVMNKTDFQTGRRG